MLDIADVRHPDGNMTQYVKKLCFGIVQIKKEPCTSQVIFFNLVSMFVLKRFLFIFIYHVFL